MKTRLLSLSFAFFIRNLPQNPKNRRVFGPVSYTHLDVYKRQQLYSVIVTRDKQMKERLAPAHFNQPMVTGAPVVLTFCADFNRFSKWCRERKAVPGYDNPCLLYTSNIE